MDAATTSVDPGRDGWRLRLPERLPDLKGPWLTLYTILWAIMLPIALIGAGRGTYISLITVPMWSPYGIATSDTPEGVQISSVMTAEARARGIRAGDYVVAIDGWTLPSIGARAAARSRVIKPDGSTTEFRIRQPDGKTFDVRLVRDMAYDRQRFREAGLSWPVARTIVSAGQLLLPIVFLGAAVLLFLRRRREAVPALLSLAFLVFGGIVNGGDLSGIGARGLAWASTLGTMCLFAALLVFPSGRFEPRWTLLPVLSLPIIALMDPQGAVGFATAGFLSLSVLAALVSRYRRVGEGTERLQLRWAFLGLVVGMILFAMSLAGDAAVYAWQAEDPRWLAWGYAIIQNLGTGGLGVMAVGLIVSILRYRLYDADAVIGRSAAYGLLTLGFVALFAASQKLIELLGEEYLGENMGAVAGGIGAALAAVAVAPLHARAQRWAERRFQNALYRLRCALPPLVGDLRETAGIGEIAGATLDSLVEGVRARRAALIAGDKLIDAREIAAREVEGWRSGWSPSRRDGIDCDEADPLFPVRVPLEAEGHGRVGWLLIGPRPDGSLFSKSELGVVEEVAEPVARALQVAMNRQQREARLEKRFKAIEKRLAELTALARPSPA